MKIFIAIILILILIVIATRLYYGYSNERKNKIEMEKYSQDVELNANLGKVLVIYYSLGGHTKTIAENIAAKTNADIYEIKLKEPYTTPSIYWKSKKQLNTKNYPKLENLPNIDNYDIIFIGAPVWWFNLNPVIFSLLKEIDFKNKNVVPFSTQQSNNGKFINNFRENIKNANVLNYGSFNNLDKKYERQINNKIIVWLNELLKN